MSFSIDEYKEITNKEDIYKIVHGFMFMKSNKSLNDTLDRFSQKKGQSSDYIIINFKNDLSQYDDPKNKVAENQVLLSADEPAVDEACEAILSFSDFFDYIEKSVSTMLSTYPEKYNKAEIKRSLDIFKESLGIHIE